MAIDILVLRHGKKENKKAVPGSEKDKRIDLSEEGKIDCFNQGNMIIPSGVYQTLDVTVSNFLRTQRTAERMLAGAGYNKNIDEYTRRADIGLSYLNWKHPQVSEYGTEKKIADAHVLSALKYLYLPQEDKSISFMSKYAFALSDSLIQSAERLTRANKEKNALIMIVTHGSIIDALDSLLYSTVSVEGKKVEVNGFPGHYPMGEYIKGEIINNSSPNPVLIFSGKGRAITLEMNDLKSRRNQAYQHSQGNI